MSEPMGADALLAVLVWIVPILAGIIGIWIAVHRQVAGRAAWKAKVDAALSSMAQHNREHHDGLEKRIGRIKEQLVALEQGQREIREAIVQIKTLVEHLQDAFRKEGGSGGRRR